MRQIKFRAWNKEAQRWAGHNELLVAIPVGASVRPPSVLTVGGDNYEIQLYTGLKDKNGEDIYEGDVVINQGENYQVLYEKLLGRFWFFTTKPKTSAETIQSSGCPSRETLYWFDSEITGNICEHPALLATQ
jgi:uncharacterized phage protein (TIGR01671 family)